MAFSYGVSIPRIRRVLLLAGLSAPLAALQACRNAPSASPEVVAACHTYGIALMTHCGMPDPTLDGWDQDCPAQSLLPGTQVTLRLVDTCIAVVNAGHCSDATYETQCDQPFTRGLLPAGAACTGTSQCASGSCTGEDVSCGVCAGDGPANTCGGAVCPAHTTCNSSQGVCVPLPQAGAPCTQDGACDVGLYCDSYKYPLICAAYQRLGDACGNASGQGSPICASPLVCTGSSASGAAATYTCQEPPPPLPLGATCDPQALVSPCVSQACAASSRTCVQPLGVGPGKACNDADHIFCVNGECYGGECSIPVPDGQTCTDEVQYNQCGPASVCDGNTCVPFVQNACGN